MYDFILQLIMIGSLSVIVYLSARALPRLTNEGELPTLHEQVGGWLERLPLHHVDDRLNALLYKSLKHLRVIMMKIDNRLMRELTRVKKHGESAQSASPVQELLDEVNNEKKE